MVSLLPALSFASVSKCEAQNNLYNVYIRYIAKQARQSSDFDSLAMQLKIINTYKNKIVKCSNLTK